MQFYILKQSYNILVKLCIVIQNISHYPKFGCNYDDI